MPSFLTSRKNVNNLPLKILSLLIAIALWFIVLGSRNVEIAKDVPVEIITPADLTIANEVPDKVTFRLAGPKAFLRGIPNRKEDTIRVNLSTAKAGLVTYRFFSDNIVVPLGVKVLSVNPTAIIIKLEPIKRKEVPVKLMTRGDSSASGHLISYSLVKATVKLRGAESRIDQITEAPTAPLDLGELKESGERELPIDMSKLSGLFVDGDMPRVAYTVTQSTANFKIRNADVKVITSRRFSVSPKEVTLYVHCSTEDLKNLDRKKVFGVVDLDEKGPGTYTTDVKVQLPSNVKLIKVLPQKVKVTLY